MDPRLTRPPLPCTSVQALEQLWCATYQVVTSSRNFPSSCTDHNRLYSTNQRDCRLFCPAIEDSCAGAPLAQAYCVEWCEQTFPVEFCEVLEVTGVPLSWPDEVQDMNTRYRLLKQREEPIIANGRPTYRSIPSRRAGFSQTRKIDYFLYSTSVAGYDEWLLDLDSDPNDGASAFVASSDLLPEAITGSFMIWSSGHQQWEAAVLNVTCEGDGTLRSSSDAPRGARGRGMGGGGGGVAGGAMAAQLVAPALCAWLLWRGAARLL